MALYLAKLGVTRVRPLAGGFPEWQKLGFPVEAIGPVMSASPSQPIGKSRG